MARIGIVGAQGTGKTTLIQALSQDETFKGFYFPMSPTRYLYKTFGFDFNSANAEIQLATLYMQLMNTLSSENVIFDRTVIDNFSYLEYYAKRGHGLYDITDSAMNFIELQTLFLAQKIDMFFILEPEFPIEDDGVRNVNVEQQREINDLIMNNFGRFKVGLDKLLIVSGSIEQRVEAIKGRYNWWVTVTKG